jgi:hypothetical protein
VAKAGVPDQEPGRQAFEDDEALMVDRCLLDFVQRACCSPNPMDSRTVGKSHLYAWPSRHTCPPSWYLDSPTARRKDA